MNRLSISRRSGPYPIDVPLTPPCGTLCGQMVAGLYGTRAKPKTIENGQIRIATEGFAKAVEGAEMNRWRRDNNRISLIMALYILNVLQESLRKIPGFVPDFLRFMKGSRTDCTSSKGWHVQ